MSSAAKGLEQTNIGEIVYNLLKHTLNLSKRRKIIRENLQDILFEFNKNTKEVHTLSSNYEITKHTPPFPPFPVKVIVGGIYSFYPCTEEGDDKEYPEDYRPDNYVAGYWEDSNCDGNYGYDTDNEGFLEGYVAGFYEEGGVVKILAIDITGICSYPLTRVVDQISERVFASICVKDHWVVYE